MRAGVKPLACGGLLACAALVGVQHAFSFLLDSDQADNSISVGYVDLAPDFFVQDGSGWQEGQTQETQEAGFAVEEWNPSVENNGPVTSYVRAWIVFDAETGCLPQAEDVNDQAWTYPDDNGFLYYKVPLEPGQRTACVFWDTLDKDMLGTFIVKFESVSALNPETGQLYASPEEAFTEVG